MGRSSLIMVAGFIFAFGFMNYTLTTTSTAIVSNYSTVIERTGAQNATNSAINYFLKKIAFDKTMARPQPYLLDVKLDQTTITTSVQILKVSTLAPDTFVLSAQSAWGVPRTGSDGKAYKDTLKSYVTVTSAELVLPPITGAIRIFDQTASFNFSGSPTKVHGEDTDTNGYVIPGGQSIPAFMVSTTADSTRLKTALTKTGVLSGAGNPPYVTEKPTQRFDINQYVTQISALASQTLTGTTINATTVLGTLSNPKITVLAPSTGSSVTISGTVTGAGILIVKADLKGTGNLTFKGLVIIVGGAQRTLSSTGSTKIYGALLLSGNTATYSSKGSGDIFYSSQALKIVKDKLSNGKIINIAWWE